MALEPHEFNLKIVIILTIGFALASFLGYLAQRLKLSPILGYLLAGFLIGPFSPGYVADLELAEQLAEVGVMLMMFGVGLHFKWQDLVNVKNIAIPGAIGQTLVAATAAAIIMHMLGGSWQVGVIIGLAIGVASTVVLVRVLSDQNLLHTPQGHIAVGWLIVEDILTVAVLILLPTIVALLTGVSISVPELLTSMAMVLVKFALLAAIMFTLGRKFVSYTLLKIAQTRSQELFTVTILALIFVIAAGSALLFGTSIALGAFIAGMVIGQTNVSHQASAYASPMKDAFVVIFFLSVGMLFNPMAIWEHMSLFLSILFVILVIKPVTAFLITYFMRYPIGTAITIALALAQIGEFSFILAEEAGRYHIFPDEGYDVIVACALISISVNPLLFKLYNYLKPSILGEDKTSDIQHLVQEILRKDSKALVIGFGVIGQAVVKTLDQMGISPVIIDRNVDTVAKLIEEKREAVYGDASHPKMLELAHIQSTNFLIITIPDFAATLNIIHYALEIHPDITIITRARHLEDQNLLIQQNVHLIFCDEKEAIEAFQKAISQLKSFKMSHSGSL
jgi:monovalent cation:H+ antiporter-2, CPA2 family